MIVDTPIVAPSDKEYSVETCFHPFLSQSPRIEQTSVLSEVFCEYLKEG